MPSATLTLTATLSVALCLAAPTQAEAAPPATADARCRAALAKAAAKLARTIAKEQQRCHGARMLGTVAPTTDCNDPAALQGASVERVEKAAAKLAAAAERRCAQAQSTADNGYWVCPRPCESIAVDDYAGVADCIDCVAEDGVGALAAAVLGAPSAPATNDEQASCQRSLARALTKYAGKLPFLQRKCQIRQDKGAIDVAIDCIVDDSKGKIARLAAQTDALIERCEPATLAALDACADDLESVKICLRGEANLATEPVMRAAMHRLPDVETFAATLADNSWLLFVPSGFNPTLGCPAGFPSLASIRADLARARAAGFTGIITAAADCTLAEIPRIAREEGFSAVIMGLFMFNEALRLEELTNAIAAAEHVDAYAVGNEGLEGCQPPSLDRYSEQTLLETMLLLRDRTGKPVASSEQLEDYLGGGGCLDGVLSKKTDWLFPITHPFNNGITDPIAGAAFTADRDQQLRASSTKPVFHKETGHPTCGHTDATPANQEIYFQELQSTDVQFAYLEFSDQPWKTGSPWEPCWGLWDSTPSPKQFIAGNDPSLRLAPAIDAAPRQSPSSAE